jgi:DNA-binding transcriptional ArsR family regulator
MTVADLIEDDRSEPDSIEQHLIRIERLLAIGFAEQVQAKRDAHEVGDDVAAEILMRSLAWTPAGELRRAVVKATGRSEPTVKRRLKKLVELGALDRRGETTAVEYRCTGFLG